MGYETDETYTNHEQETKWIHFNYINKPTRCTFCMYLFYNFCTTLHVSNDHFVHHQNFMIYCICSSVKTVQTCLRHVCTVCACFVTRLNNCCDAAAFNLKHGKQRCNTGRMTPLILGINYCRLSNYRTACRSRKCSFIIISTVRWCAGSNISWCLEWQGRCECSNLPTARRWSSLSRNGCRGCNWLF